MNHQPPDWDCKFGHSEIIKNQLYICGEDDLDELLYGNEEALNINQRGNFTNPPTPQIDVWIDLRDIRETNRQVFLPETVEYISIPFRDGVLEEAIHNLPVAKKVLTEKLNKNKRVIVSCHQGKSRSVMLVLWYLSEKFNSFFEAYWLIKENRPIMEPDKKFQPLLKDWKETYRSNEF